MIEQIEFTLRPYPRGIHLITSDVMRQLSKLPQKGLLNLLIKHTSAALALNENADPDVRHDLRTIFDRLVPESAPYYLHRMKANGYADLNELKAHIAEHDPSMPIPEWLRVDDWDLLLRMPFNLN